MHFVDERHISILMRGVNAYVDGSETTPEIAFFYSEAGRVWFPASLLSKTHTFVCMCVWTRGWKPTRLAFHFPDVMQNTNNQMLGCVTGWYGPDRRTCKLRFKRFLKDLGFGEENDLIFSLECTIQLFVWGCFFSFLIFLNQFHLLHDLLDNNCPRQYIQPMPFVSKQMVKSPKRLYFQLDQGQLFFSEASLVLTDHPLRSLCGKPQNE